MSLILLMKLAVLAVVFTGLGYFSSPGKSSDRK